MNQSNQQLQVTNQKLNEAHQSKSKLINNISHEIRSPLTIIRAYTKGMMDGVIERNPQYIELVYDKSIYLLKILEDLQALAEIDNRQIKFDWERVDIRKFSQKLFKKHKLVLEKHRISFEYKDVLSYQENPVVLIDMIRIEQVIVNLLTNAQRFVGENRKIILELDQEGENHTLLKVIDNGVGIKDSRYFIRFLRITNLMVPVHHIIHEMLQKSDIKRYLLQRLHGKTIMFPHCFSGIFST